MLIIFIPIVKTVFSLYKRSRKRISGPVNQEVAKKQPKRPESSSSTPKTAKSRGRSKNGNGSKSVSIIEDDDSHLQPSTSSGSPSASR